MTRAQLGRARRGRGIFPAATALLVLGVVIACGNPTPPSPSAPASAAPSGSAEAVATPRPTPWPGNAVLGIEAMGVADGQILEAINDFNKGVATEDLALMREAANGLAGIDVLLPNVDKISIFEPMKPFAQAYGAAITAIAAAARAERTAIDARDGAAITSSSQALVSALTLYTGVQSELASWVEQATEQRRMLAR
jgi:hypothetical protein